LGFADIFAQVSLVRSRTDEKIYALKTLRKSEMLKQSEVRAGNIGD
jgi:hypothetical protein